MLTGRGAVVVGGSHGIGKAVAEKLAACGASVVVNGRDAEAAQATAAAIAAAGGTAVAFGGSAADEATAAQLIDTCTNRFGGIDILVNCAGIAEPLGSSILDVSTATFTELIDAHLMTAFQTCRAAAPKMVTQRGGAIINTSSFAYLGDYGGTGYPAGKGAVTSLTLAVAAELKEHGVRANVVCPGAKTRLSSGPDYQDHINGLQRRGILDEEAARQSLDAPPPDYVAPLYALLASDLAAQVTGQIFVASGGYIGRFDRQIPKLVGYRDHHTAPPWSLAELHEMVDRSGPPTQERAMLL